MTARRKDQDWKQAFAFWPVRLIDGTRSRWFDKLMTRVVQSERQYRLMSDAEEAADFDDRRYSGF